MENEDVINRFHTASVQETAAYFQTDLQTGLSHQQAESQLQKYGENKFKEKKRQSVLAVFLGQFKDLLVFILIVASLLSGLTGSWENTVVIVAVLLLNALLGTIQHFKAEKSLESLKSISSPYVKVMREGEVMTLSSEKLVPGDLLLLDAGDLVTADGRIVENHSLKVNESSLTGESEHVEKTSETLKEEQLPLGDQKNMVFSGSFVTYGHAVCIVTHTGMNCEMGKIAALMNSVEEKRTPLQISLDTFSKRFSFLIIGICILVFGLEVYRNAPIIDAMLFAIALAVAAIPEALSSIITIVQAMGVQRMVKEHAIVKELKAVETLGSITIICSDKTGTLTQNRMTVQSVYSGGKAKDPAAMDRNDYPDRCLSDIAVLTNDSVINEEEEIGDPTETALVEMVNRMGIEETEIRKEFPRIAELPFDSNRKLMSTLHHIDGRYLLFTKGAADVLLSRSTHILTDVGIREITQNDIKSAQEYHLEMSQNGFRVLAFGMKILKDKGKVTLETECDFAFVGLIAMMDPPREESKQAVEDARRAGIRTVMITGDHKETASAIAKKIGIWRPGDIAVTGRELDQMSDEELGEKIARIAVYARVSPEDKIRIVKVWQEKGQIVAMTGDGVNDAPALRKADIGVAMGITGTEVAKDAASMILTDDHFATIVKAVANGRNIFTNIKNAILFLLSGNAAGILAVFYTALIPNLPAPFAAVQLLFINLITDSLPALAIGMEPSQESLLNRPPRNPKESILNRSAFLRITYQGILIALSTLSSYFIGLAQGGAFVASTMAFSTLCLARLFHGFNCRSEKDIFHLGLFSNRFSVMAFLAGFLLLSAVLFCPPLMTLFAVAPIQTQDVLWIILLAFLPTVIIQIGKCIFGVFARKQRERI